ncbi:stage II sporulation protein M [Carboxylicivirga sp. M1479]|uniref:stage II sporulation protein M n=1 Tax=Carboxylicivirga sp. M1479 TaxID=2594476 RepID=UPI001178AE81|nr:stage II sporulation protein M [Carboxylicivirga sp. M1479]TRX72212.1 stage II sporulation protein M [Carboxylicivirga sp. M1479]
MKEITFINRNQARWGEFEKQLKKPSKINPDTLADQFIQLTDDLAFARTFYPRTHTLAYLNSLSQKAHQEIYRNKREKGSRIPSFFKTELPLVLRSARPYFIISFFVFMASWALGVVSSLTDIEFVRTILGDTYVNMTLDNIEKGDPMAVYGQMGEMPMSFYIIFNNVTVAWQVFLYGFLTPLGAIYRLFFNGVMVGAFQAFFFEKNLLGVSTYAIMIHGTLELSAIVLAGGAGIMLGKFLLFPGTYPRKESFIHGSVVGVKVMIPITIVFFIAGLLEGFVTRHYNTIDNWLNVLIIAGSMLVIVWYFFIYPSIVYSKFKNK